MPRLGTVAIIGVGLIGGSIGKALRERGLAERVVGIGRDPLKLADGVRLGAIDEGTTDPRRGVAEAEVVVVCTPVPQIAADVRNAAEWGLEGVLVTDAGSTKRELVEEVARHPRARAVFVAGHPIAGSERKGVAYADGNLFAGRTCILTPTSDTDPDRLLRARHFWTGLGCRLIETSPEAHDRALALTSHLPHAVASALAGVVPVESLAMAAGAYRDGTRVAGSDASLWTGIFRANRDSVLESVTAFQERLTAFKNALVADDEQVLIDLWNTAKLQRAHFDAENLAPSTES